MICFQPATFTGSKFLKTYIFLLFCFLKATSRCSVFLPVVFPDQAPPERAKEGCGFAGDSERTGVSGSSQVKR